MDNNSERPDDKLLVIPEPERAKPFGMKKIKVSVLKLRDTFHDIIKNINKELIEKGADPQSLPSPFIVSFIIKYSKEMNQRFSPPGGMETGLYIIDEVSIPAYNITFPRLSLIDIFDGIPCCNSYYNINCFDLVQK